MSKPVVYQDDFIKATENLKLVLKALAAYQIPASPLNYQVFYEIVSGRNAPLKTALDQLVEKQDQALGEEDLLALYNQHLSQDDAALQEQRVQLQKFIKMIQAHYGGSRAQVADYLGSLENFSELLASPVDVSELAGEVQKVMDETRGVEQLQRQFDEKMCEVMKEMSSLRSELEQVREESLTDALTGLANRKAFNQFLDEVISESNSEEPVFSVIIADIDHFKKFNDSYGHLVGDKVLKYVSRIIKSCVKGKDIAARFGGEEFTLLLPDTDVSGAQIVAEQIRKAIAHTKLRDHSVNEDYGTVTISLGVSQYRANEKHDEILERADKALYQAKDNGRNRVERSA